MQTKRVFLLFCMTTIGVVLITSLGFASKKADVAKQLMDADRAFASEAAKRGIDGWMSFYAEDAARFAMGGEAARGLKDIRAMDQAMFGDPTVKLVWEPTDAGVFGDKTHGFTTGRYHIVKTGLPPDTLSSGGYVTMWRRDRGEWRVILDTGAGDCE